MDLTNLRESLDVSGEQSPAALCHEHDERLTDEFRVAALQLTNLYKQGRQNTHKAFAEGYARALYDTIECLNGPAQESPLEAQAQLDRLRNYLLRRLETLQSDAQEHEEGVEGRTQSTSPSARLRRPYGERRPESHRATSHDAKPKAPSARHEHGRRAPLADAEHMEESESETTAPVAAPAAPPRKRRRPIWGAHSRPQDRG
ncbi:hypothetical protein MNAN1_002671 [Malassezia nana]|uniref:Uncharacterized protein n=1 Tax=Malassezia nana TaxID=180528 RepID=A0AAF0J840_9BASI|nr:hypothetical protein MNAN1_002671 [Malassezia nana]